MNNTTCRTALIEDETIKNIMKKKAIRNEIKKKKREQYKKPIRHIIGLIIVMCVILVAMLLNLLYPVVGLFIVLVCFLGVGFKLGQLSLLTINKTT